MEIRNLFVDKSESIVVNMNLAIALDSIDKAILLTRLNYWIEKNRDANRNFYDGYYWACNSYNDWQQEDFPLWSISKIGRLFRDLEDQGIILSANYNQSVMDKTKWYTIDYDILETSIVQKETIGKEYSKDSNESIGYSKRSDHEKGVILNG